MIRRARPSCGVRSRGAATPSLLPQRGAASVELVLLVPSLLIMIGLVVAGGRLWFARAAVDDAAAAAARAASLARTPTQAQHDAAAVARSGLDASDLHCKAVAIEADTAAFAIPPGQPGTVGATVSCSVDLADVFLPGLPGTVRLTATESSPLDTYRSRS